MADDEMSPAIVIREFSGMSIDYKVGDEVNAKVTHDGLAATVRGRNGYGCIVGVPINRLRFTDGA